MRHASAPRTPGSQRRFEISQLTELPLGASLAVIGRVCVGEIFLGILDPQLDLRPVELHNRNSLLGQNSKPRRRHFRKTAAHEDARLVAAIPHAHNARREHGHSRRMIDEHAKDALNARDIDLIDILGNEKPLRRNEFETKFVCHSDRGAGREAADRSSSLCLTGYRLGQSPPYAASASFCAFAITSSIVPTM